MDKNKLNKKFIRVTYNNIGHYIQEADTLEQFTENFVKEFKLDTKRKNFFLKCKDSAHRITKIEKEEAYKKYINYLIKYPKLVEPFFTAEDKVIHKNTICSECKKGSRGCVQCKKELIEAMNNFLKPIQERRKQYEENPKLVQEILDKGTKEAKAKAEETMKKVKEAIMINY